MISLTIVLMSTIYSVGALEDICGTDYYYEGS